MAARRLAIDLWRLETGQTTAQKLGLIMQLKELEQVKTKGAPERTHSNLNR
jgi:hypothetical protein